jgi:transcriptional regulator with XRE-family HTH domain
MIRVSFAKNKPIYTNREKRAIVSAAYAAGTSLRAVARMYRVSPGTISKWKRNVENLSESVLHNMRHKHSYNLGRTPKNANVYPALYAYFEDTRAMHRPVTMAGLIVEYRKLTPQENTAFNVVRDRLRRWLKRAQLTRRRVTHQAQNTRHVKQVMVDFVNYVNGLHRLA